MSWWSRESRRRSTQGFRPAVLANHAFRREVAATGGGVPLVLGLERPDGSVSCFETQVFPEGHPRAEANLIYAERLVKFLLWQRGGYKVYVGGPRQIGEFLRECYAPGGRRAFDYQFMGEQVYQRPFTVVPCAADDVPPEQEKERPLGRHLDGCRIGFDLGASDLKIAAVVDGQVVYSDEIVWDPRNQTDPEYHYRAIRAAIRTAAAKMPRVDAIGGSSAGIIVDNRPMVASLFRGVPSGAVRPGAEPVPAPGRGDGGAAGGGERRRGDGAGRLDVAGAGRQCHPGHRAGVEPGGRLCDAAGKITGWLNELAFCPVDYSPGAPGGRMVGRQGLRRALFFAAVRLPAGAAGRDRASRRGCRTPKS